jgi:hypothetical protein
MRERNKILRIFGIFYIVLALLIYFGLKEHLKTSFSTEKLSNMISGKSIYRDTTTDLCKYQILGDPKEVGNYVKVNILCKDGKKASSTVSLSAIEDKTLDGFISEYARIIGFDKNIIDNNFICTLDGVVLTNVMRKSAVQPISSLNCVEKK